MRTILVLLGVLAFLAMSVAAFAVVDDFPYTMYTPNTLMAMPAVPLEPAPATVFGSVPIHLKLMRWNADTQSWISYSQFNPAQFGNILIGEGYWMKTTTAQPVNYQGLTDTDAMDIWISLPQAGWNLIGNPFPFNYTWANAKVTDGNETISMASAKSRGWLKSKMDWWDGEYQSLRTCGISTDFPYTQELYPWHGYYLKSNIDKLALILESPL